MVNAVSLYYVFSFAFNRVPLREQVPVTGGTCYIGELLQKGLKELRGEHYSSVQYHQSEETESPMARSAIYIPFHHLSINTQAEPIEIVSLGSGSKKSHIALFESGMGVITIMIEPDTAPNINQLSQVARRDSLPLIRYKDRDIDAIQDESLHNIFKDEVSTLNTDINKILSGLDKKTHVKLGELYPNLPSKTKKTDHTFGSIAPSFIVSWIDADEGLIWHDFEAGSRGLDVFQEPSVALVVKVAPTYRDAIDPKSPKRKEIEHAVSSILHATIQEQMDASHAIEHTAMDLRNLCSDRRFRTFFHLNCLLVLHSEEQDSAQLIEFKRGLFRTYCAVRGCWHMYNVVNEQLDRSINLLFSRFKRLASTTASENNFLEKKSEVILTKGSFLVILAVEDPLVRAIRLTEYGVLYDEAAYAFRLEEIRQLVKYKLSELDNLYEMISAYQMRLQYASAPLRESIGYLLRLAIIFAIVASFSIWQLPKWFPFSKMLWVPIAFGSIAIVLAFIWFVLRIFYKQRSRDVKGVSNG